MICAPLNQLFLHLSLKLKNKHIINKKLSISLEFYNSQFLKNKNLQLESNDHITLPSNKTSLKIKDAALPRRN